MDLAFELVVDSIETYFSNADVSVVSRESASPAIYASLRTHHIWNAELQERTGKFRKQANAIAEWDRRILQNRDVLLRLEIEVAKVVETQSNLERQLVLVETHQQEVL
nr:nuclear pore complex protein nup62 [Quercus suber]